MGLLEDPLRRSLSTEEVSGQAVLSAISRAWQSESKTDACGDSQHCGNMKEWETPRETGNEAMKTLDSVYSQ